MEQELLTRPEHLSSTPVFSWVRVARSLDFCLMFCRSLFAICIMSIFFVLSNILQYTVYESPLVSAYPFNHALYFMDFVTRSSYKIPENRRIFKSKKIDRDITNEIIILPSSLGAVVAVIVWYLNLQLPMQSVPITTDVVSSNLDQGEVYNIMR